jgi:hypothetical protein
LPAPSQFAASVAVSPVQVAARQSAFEKVHAAVAVPLHVPLQAVPSPAHAARGDTGCPFTGEQVPGFAARLHAWH